MPKYLIVREIPGAGNMTPKELQGASRTSCDALRSIGTDIQWIHSYVTADRITCVYYAENEELIHEHARRSGFPANQVMQVTAIIEPFTAEEVPTLATA